MKKKSTIVFLCQNILSDKNRTQYNRTKFLCERFKTHIVGKSTISESASTNAASISKLPENKVFSLFFPIWAVLKILQLKIKYKPEILYSTYEPITITMAFFSTYLMNIVWVSDIWDDPAKSVMILEGIPTFKSRFKLIIKRFELVVAAKFLKHADKVVTLIKDELIQKYSVNSERILPITNGINLELDFPVNEKDMNGKFLTIFYCGTVDRVRLEGIYECFSYLLHSGFSIKFIVIGYELNGGYQWLGNELGGLGGRLSLDMRSVQKYDSVVKAIGESNICICPYPNKLDLAPAYPIKLFDYMAAGRPIVASALKGIRKILTNEFDALLFEPGNYKSMAQQIKRLADSKILRQSLTLNALKTVKNYSWEKIHQSVFEFIQPD